LFRGCGVNVLLLLSPRWATYPILGEIKPPVGGAERCRTEDKALCRIHPGAGHDAEVEQMGEGGHGVPLRGGLEGGDGCGGTEGVPAR